MSAEINLEIDIPMPYADRVFSVAFKASLLAQGTTALFGASGAGKSTLLHALTGLPKHRQARVILGDTIVQDNKTYIRPQQRGIFYVSNERQLFPHMSVLQNWLYAQKLAKKRFRGNKNTLLSTNAKPVQLDPSELAEQFKLSSLCHARPQTLSTGEAQKASIVRALLTSPNLLLLDEPLGNIDYTQKQQLITFIQHIGQTFQIPMLYVSHHAEEVAAIAQKVLIIANGRLQTSGSIEQLLPLMLGGDSQKIIPTNQGVLCLTPPERMDVKTCTPADIVHIASQGRQMVGSVIKAADPIVTLNLPFGQVTITARAEFLKKYSLNVGSKVCFCQF